MFQGIREYADQTGIEIEGLPKDPKADVPPGQLLPVLRNFLPSSSPCWPQPLRNPCPRHPDSASRLQITVPLACH
jgi:hypothetical protein